MKYLLLLVSLMFTAPFAQAQETRTEFFYQASVGETFFQGNLQKSSVTHDYDTSGLPPGSTPTSLDLSDLDINLAFETGLNELMAYYANMGYGQGSLENSGANSQNYDGLDPINLGLKFRLPIGPGQVFARTNLGLGFLSDLDCPTSADDCKRMDNSINLALRLGYLMTYNTAFAGFALDYGLFSTDAENSDFDLEKENGLALTAFYEKIYSQMIVGGALSYQMASIYSTYFSPFNSIYTIDSDRYKANVLGLKLYTRLPLSESFALLGSFKYDFLVDQKDPVYDGGSGFGLNLGLRMNL